MNKSAKPLLFSLLLFLTISSQAIKSDISFTVTMENPSSQTFHLKMELTGTKQDIIDFKMPVWTPGCYQIIDFAKNVSNFEATDVSGNKLPFSQTNNNTWRVAGKNASNIILNYNVKATVPFVAMPYLKWRIIIVYFTPNQGDWKIALPILHFQFSIFLLVCQNWRRYFHRTCQ